MPIIVVCIIFTMFCIKNSFNAKMYLSIETNFDIIYQSLRVIVN